MMISNSFLAYFVLKNKPSTITSTKKSPIKRQSASVTVLIITTLFILFTLPGNINDAFFIPILINYSYDAAINFFFDNLMFTYHALSFVILFVSNKRFLNEFKLCIRSLFTEPKNNTSRTTLPLSTVLQLNSQKQTNES